MYAAVIDHQTLRRRRPEPSWRALGRRLAVGAALLGLLGFGLAQTVHGSAPGAYETVTVGSGQTLWEIAGARYPHSDIRAKVGEIEDANGLTGPLIRPGQKLRVPAA